MQIAVNAFIILVCCVALGVSANWLVDSAGKIARRIGVSELVIGLTIVAFGSSAPEFAVTVYAAMQGNSDMIVGNIVGSNIFNIGFVLGGCALIARIKTNRHLVWRDGVMLLVSTVFLLAVLWDNHLNRYEGIALFLMLVAYLFLLFRRKEPIIEDYGHIPATLTKSGLMLLASLVLIAISGHFLVTSATTLAQLCGMPQWVIAITVVAAGTSVPELTISLVASIKKQHGISAGNLIGSNIFNTLGVLGLAGAINPLTIDPFSFYSIASLVVLTLIVVIFMRSRWHLSRVEGAVLILISLMIWGYNFTKQEPGSPGTTGLKQTQTTR